MRTVLSDIFDVGGPSARDPNSNAGTRPGVIESTHTRCQPKSDSIGIIASLWRRFWPFGATPEIPAPSLAVKIEMRNQGSLRDIAVGRNVRLWLLADIQPHPELRPLYPRKQTSRWVPLYVCL